MDAPLTVYGFETSNNIKVRIALGYKELDYEFRAIDPSDRSTVVELSGQSLTPVLTHGTTVLFDSAAILRYLDASFRDTPPLFGTSREEQWAIEDLELDARCRLAGPMMAFVHARVAGRELADAERARLGAAFRGEAGALMQRLGDRRWLVGERMSAADVTAAAVLYRVREGGMFELPEAVEARSDWIDRVLGFDRMLRA